MKKTTEMMLAEMLTENTGTHFLDSGGAYGRNWERNQGKTLEYFEAEPIASVNQWGYSKSTFHFLKGILDYDVALDKKFQNFLNRKSEKYNSWLTSADNFLKYLQTRGYVYGLYGDGEPTGDNSYNHDSALDQVIQYTVFTFKNYRLRLDDITKDIGEGYLPEGTYCILQIHGGCDVRGGYTRPRLFSFKEDPADIFMDDYGLIACKGVSTGVIEGQLTVDGSPIKTWTDPHEWTTDDNYHWYQEGLYTADSPTLSDFEVNEDTGNLICPDCGADISAVY